MPTQDHYPSQSTGRKAAYMAVGEGGRWGTKGLPTARLIHLPVGPCLFLTNIYCQPSRVQPLCPKLDKPCAAALIDNQDHKKQHTRLRAVFAIIMGLLRVAAALYFGQVECSTGRG